MSTSRREFLGAGTRIAAAMGFGSLAAPMVAMAAKAPAISATALGAGFWLISGAGCNVLAVKGPEHSLLVDGGLQRNAKDLLKAAARATGNKRVGTLINTHWHPAQTGSNETVGAEGGEIIAHEVTRQYLARAVASVDYDGLYGPLAVAGRPVKTTRTTGELQFAGHDVRYGYLPAAHTNGDLYIHFPEANLLVAGGPVATESWPLIDWRNGAWLGGLVRAHESLVALVMDDTRVVPAHGRMLNGAELKRHHAMYAAFHEQMVVFQNRGYDSGDCIAQRPLKDFEGQFGDATAFIRGAFHSLNLAYSPD